MTEENGGQPGTMIHREEYEAAARRIQDRISFYAHFTWFFWLNLLFLLLNTALTPDQWWSLIVGSVWGAGLLIHLVATFFIADLEGPFRERAFQKELQRLKRRFQG